MNTSSTPLAPKWIWTGRILSAAPCLLMLLSAAMEFSQTPGAAKGFEHLGWPLDLARPLGFLELACIALYLVPRTAVLGAVLLTGYLGGATATHLRVGDPFFATVLVGVLLWAGLWLREPQLRTLLPWRK